MRRAVTVLGSAHQRLTTGGHSLPNVRCRHIASAAASYDAVIVGAGVMGSAIAFEMSKAGWKVLAIEQGPAVGQPASTAMSCGILRTMYSHIDSVKLAHE